MLNKIKNFLLGGKSVKEVADISNLLDQKDEEISRLQYKLDEVKFDNLTEASKISKLHMEHILKYRNIISTMEKLNKYDNIVGFNKEYNYFYNTFSKDKLIKVYVELDGMYVEKQTYDLTDENLELIKSKGIRSLIEIELETMKND